MLKKIVEKNLDQQSIDMINHYFKTAKDFSCEKMLYIHDEKIYFYGKLIDEHIEQLLTTMEKPITGICVGNDEILNSDIYKNWRNNHERKAFVDGFTLEFAKQKVDEYAETLLTNMGYLNKNSYISWFYIKNPK